MTVVNVMEKVHLLEVNHAETKACIARVDGDIRCINDRATKVEDEVLGLRKRIHEHSGTIHDLLGQTKHLDSTLKKVDVTMRDLQKCVNKLTSAVVNNEKNLEVNKAVLLYKKWLIGVIVVPAIILLIKYFMV